MTKNRYIVDAPRAAACLLLAVGVFFGPAGLGGSPGFVASSSTCGLSCPCVEAAQVERAGDRVEAAAADSGEDACPGDCPQCGCCLGLAMAVLPLPLTSSAVGWTAARRLAPIDAPASGAGAAVFRPPRSLS
ncbi:MAG: hypothetical protein IPL40_11010 [Proteobacteria bacterium]|nr:hypothetical protein [Pseudomonadota bacterium]